MARRTRLAWLLGAGLTACSSPGELPDQVHLEASLRPPEVQVRVVIVGLLPPAPPGPGALPVSAPRSHSEAPSLARTASSAPRPGPAGGLSSLRPRLRSRLRPLRPRRPGDLGPELLALDPGEGAQPPTPAHGRGLGFNLGVGEAPYDDNLADIALLPEDLLGFSDAMVQVTYSQPLGSSVALVGSVATIRFQDEPLMEALSDPQLTWVTLGFRVRF